MTSVPQMEQMGSHRTMIKSLLRNILCGVSMVFGITGIVLVVLLAFGYRPFILSSESMEPLYSKGSLCLIKTTYTPDDVNVGDVIAYRSDAGALVLHRVVEIEGTMLWIIAL